MLNIRLYHSVFIHKHCLSRNLNSVHKQFSNHQFHKLCTVPNQAWVAVVHVEIQSNCFFKWRLVFFTNCGHQWPQFAPQTADFLAMNPHQKILFVFFVLTPFFPDALLLNKSRMRADFSVSSWEILLPFSETS